MKEFKKTQTKKERYEELKLKYGNQQFFVKESDYTHAVDKGPKVLTKYILNDNIDNFEGNLIDIIDMLQDYVDEYGESTRLVVYDSDYDYCSYAITTDVMETEEQFKKRVEEIKERIEYMDLKTEFAEIASHERLKKKYES